MKNLSAVYDHNEHQVGEFEEVRKQRVTLLPIAHMTQSAQIEVNLTLDGEFMNAKIIDNERTIVPMTLGSANRAGSAVRPHYLHDKLFYVAGDYLAYGGEEKREKYFPAFKEQLGRWANEPEAPPEVKAIYTYIAKERVIKDLVAEKILPVDEDGKVIPRIPGRDRPEIYKVVTGNVLGAFVRFNVIQPNTAPVWENKAIFDQFISYFNATNEEERGICYVTGKSDEILTTQHGSRIRNAGDLSKLISANDHRGFTYRGRFKTPTEAVQVGFDVSQKAHHALRWLFQRQGSYVDSRYFVTFGIEESDVPDPYDDGLAFLSKAAQEQAEQSVLTEEVAAREIAKALQGYETKFKRINLQNIIVMAVDAATSGRLGIVYYQEIHPEHYLKAIEKWHTTCRWLQVVRDSETKQIRRFVGTPSTYRIVEAVYGSRADARIKKDLYTRLLPCIVEGKPLPRDIVRLIYNRVINPFSFQGLQESWEATLNIACALVNKQYESEGFTVGLIEDNDSRDYLFGRLLGVAEVMERNILKDRNEQRATNATRYFNAYSQHPARTWQVIRKQLTPYFERLGYNASWYAKLLQEIEARMSVEQMTDDPLGPVFILGYSSQIQHMYTKREDKENDSTE